MTSVAGGTYALAAIWALPGPTHGGKRERDCSVCRLHTKREFQEWLLDNAPHRAMRVRFRSFPVNTFPEFGPNDRVDTRRF